MMNHPEENHGADRLDWIDDVADRFEAAWHDRPEIKNFLAHASPRHELPLLLELIKIDLEYRRRAGETCRLEDYFEDFPTLKEADQATHDELIRHACHVAETVGRRKSESARATLLHCPHCGERIDISGPQKCITCSSCGEPLRVDPLTPEQQTASTILGKFQLIELVGTGSFGRVYRARDVELGRTVALKVPRSSSFATAEDETRFLREARNASCLDHPGIVKVHDIARDGDTPFIICDLIEGQTLAGAMTERRFSARESAAITERIADALHYAHEHNVVHRDIKPTNILVDRDGLPHITDFGLARHEQSETILTLDGQVLGTPAYMSPEQAVGNAAARVDRRTDIYSLAVILFELLSGERPFRGNSRMLLHQVLHDDPRPPRSLNDSIPRDLESICLKAMAKTAARRYETAAEFRDDLRRFLNGEPTMARPTTSVGRFARWARRSPATAALLIVSITMLLGLAAGLSVYARQLSIHAQQLSEALLTASQQRKQAQASELRARKTSYQFDLRVAYRVWDEHRLNEISWLLGRQMFDTIEADLRGLEWYLLKQLASRRLSEVGHHQGAATELAVFPDGRSVATVGADGNIRIWDTESKSQVRSIFVQEDSLYAVVVSPDGKTIAVGSSSDLFDESHVWLYDVQTGRRTQELQTHSTNIEAIEYSPDGKWLASGSRSGSVQIWSFEDASMRTIQTGQWNESLQFSADSLSLACQMKNEQLGIWDLQTLKLIQSVSNGGKPYWFSWSKTSDMIAYATPHFRSVEFWSPASENRRATVVSAHSAEISALSFSSDGEWLAVGLFDGNVEMWKISANADSAAPLDSLIVTTDRPAETVVNGSISCLAFLDEERLAVTGSDGSVVVYFPFVTDRHWTASQATGLCSFSPDGRFLAYECDDGRIHFADAASGENLFQSELGRGSPTSITFAAGHPRVAATFTSRQIVVWTTDEHQLHLEAVLETPADEHSPTQVVLSRDGSKLLSVDEDEHGIRVWDVASQRHERTLDTRFGSRLVSLSPDEELVATGNDFVYVWDFPTGRELLTLKDGDFISSLVFTSDSRVLVTGHRDGSIRVRQMSSGRLLHLMTGHQHAVQAMVVTPDGKTLVTADMGGVVRLWGVETGEGFGVLHRIQQPDEVYIVSLSLNSVTGCLAVGNARSAPQQNILLFDPAGWNPEQVSAATELSEHGPTGPQASRSGVRASDKGFLSLKLSDYLKLLDWTGRQGRSDRRGKIPAALAPMLERIGIDCSMWCDLVWSCKRYFGRSRVIGRPENMQQDAAHHGHSWVHGQRSAAAWFSE